MFNGPLDVKMMKYVVDFKCPSAPARGGQDMRVADHIESPRVTDESRRMDSLQLV